MEQSVGGEVTINQLPVQTLNLSYPHHQWSDEADTLQLGSTDEYFETVEYEPDRTLEHRDIL